MKLAQEYVNVLETKDASSLLALPLHKRLYVMKTLSKLSKFLGCYAQWQKIRQDYGLSWKDDQDDIAVFKRMTEGDANIDAMINWVKQAHYLAPKYRHVLRYAYLTGLRPEEVFMSLRLSNDGNYYNKEKGILEHYRHPDLFIRQKKKAYVSVMTEELSQLRAINTNGLSYNALRLTMRRNHTPMNMQYCRRIFGTYLRQQGIETELIDLLQGRLPKTVFLRFYNRPNFKDECEKVRNCLIKLSAEITL